MSTVSFLVIFFLKNVFKIKQVFFNFFFSLKKCIYVNAESLKICGQFCDDFVCARAHVHLHVCFKARSFPNLLGKGL